MERMNTGWRKSAPVSPIACPKFIDKDRSDLFHAARLATEALRLKPACRFVLEQLAGCFRQPIGDRLLVWPSNEWLCERTGLSERTIRYVLAALLEVGVIAAKDSANGKRFAIRSKSGQIMDAYGLDLTPLIARQDEYAARVEMLKTEREIRKRAFDEITICRRATEEALRSIEEWFPEIDTDAHQRACDALRAQTPRRDGSVDPGAPLASWRALRQEVEAKFHAACAGNSCRHIKDNNDAPDQSCSNGSRENEGARPSINLVDLIASCPDAVGFAGEIRNERDLVYEAKKLRGAVLRAHESAWFETEEKIGPVMTAAAVMVVLQIYCDNPSKITNPGGFMRSYARKIVSGEIDLVETVRGMRRKRAH